MDNSKKDELDRLGSALYACVRVTKRSAYWDEIRRRSGVNLDRPGAYILMLLGKEPCQFRDLVNRLGVEAPAVSRKVHDLEAAGLIMRRPAQDRRVHLLALSDSGRAAADSIKSARRDMLSQVLSGWTAGDRRQLSELLIRLSEDLDRNFSQKELSKP